MALLRGRSTVIAAKSATWIADARETSMGEAKWEHRMLAGVLLATCLVLLPKFWNGFVYDDIFVFVVNDTIHDPANIPSLFTHNAIWVVGRVDPMVIDTYRPLTLTTFALDSIWTGRNPFGYHLVNLLLHLACIVLVYAVARAAMRPDNRRFAWVPAAWFGLSPWLGEAHIWINGRSDPLCALFVLGSFLIWDRALTSKRWQLHAATAALMFCALLCKEVALGVLPSFLLWPSLQRLNLSARQRIMALWSPTLGAAAYLVVRLTVLGGLKSHQDTAQLSEAVSNFGLLFFDALRAAVAPSPPYLKSLVESYIGVPQAVRWAALVAALVVIALAVSMRRRHAALAWSVVLFAGALAPASLITTLIWPGFGRYLYLPLAGLCIGVVDTLIAGLERLGAFGKPSTKRIVVLGVGLYLAGSAFLLHSFARDFHDDGTLYGAVIQHVPDQAYGHAFLGMSLVTHGHADAAIEYLREAVRIQPLEPKYRFFLGQALVRTGGQREAAGLAERWLRNGRPQDAPQYLLVIVDAVESTDPPRATAAALACLHRDPGWGTCLQRLQTLTDQHPRAKEYRAAVREQLARPQNRSIAPRVESALELGSR